MIDDGTPGERERLDELGDEPADEGVPADVGRHYVHDPDGLAEHARDEDERDADERLVLDQVELEELGLLLDDPHQPDPE